MPSKFLNISTDTTLGGSSASDSTVSSQKAIKAYVDSQTGTAPAFANITGQPTDNTNLASALNAKYDASNPNGYTSNVGTVTSVNNVSPVNGNVTISIPSEVTETTVSGWGFTKNTGTVTSVNNTSPDANGDVSINIPQYSAGTNISIDRNIPAGYTELEYIEATGTQYIDTGISVNIANSFEVDFIPISTNSEAHLISQGNASLRISTSAMTWYSKNYHFFTAISVDTNYSIEAGENYFTVNGNSISGTSDSDAVSGTSVYLLARNTGVSFAKARLKKAKIYNPSSVLVFDGIPAQRTSDNAIGLYDKISNTFFTNAGTGEFNAGAVVITTGVISVSGLATVATSGSYTDLSNKPTIPTVNNATLTITQGGTTKGTFTANASSNVTIDLDSGGGGASRNIGEIIQSTIPLTDAGLHLLDGSLISGSGSYSDFVTHIAGLVSGHSELFTTEANWQTSVTNYGVCGKFVYDSVNNTVRLPKYSDKIWSGLGIAGVKGNGMTLGLTDGTNTGGLYGWSSGDINAFASSNGNYGKNIGIARSGSINLNTGKTLGITTDGTKSGMIVDLSTITTALDGYWYIVIATSTKTQIEVDIDEIATDLNGKADVDLNNCTKPHIVETYVNGASWYRIYSDGWCEQGGYYANSSSGVKNFTLLKPYNDTNYFLACSSIYTSNGGTNHQESMNEFVSKSTTGFGKYIWANNTNFWWKASGYIS